MTPANARVHRLLGSQVVRDVLGAEAGAGDVEIGPLEANYFSFTFRVKAAARSGPRDVFVKIPKTDVRGTPEILPITPEDRRMAQEEERSLRLLERGWNGDWQVRWVKIRGVVPEYNAIVTDRVRGDDATAVFRRLDIRRRLGFHGEGERLRGLMSRLGAALGRFHRSNYSDGVFLLSDEMPKLERYCEDLSSDTGSPLLMRVLKKLRSMNGFERPSGKVPTLKGLDVRNVLVGSGDALFLLDPGKMKIAYREADLARFLTTYRILYWGSKSLPVLREPDRGAEEAFLSAYYAQSRAGCPQLFKLFLLKEQLKHWRTALDSLRRRRWAPWVKAMAARVYVTPFYSRQISLQLEQDFRG
ncbi:MAG: hypothetical protein HY921_05895 [Elusimicrobia bacterium]|nr:hypothetical protein [Elusimicrobiota bacterium]